MYRVPEGWNYLAGRVDGDGHIEIIETELPLRVNSISRTLSTPPSLSGTIDHEVKRLKVNGRSLFEPGNTVILAELNGILRSGGLLMPSKWTGDSWTLEAVGFSGYPIDMPYDGEHVFPAQTDPLDIYRHIWSHLQSQPNGDLGVTVDSTTSPVRLGVEGSEEDPPRRFNWWDTTNLGEEINSYARETPFDWLEQLSWLNDEPHCHIRLGYPQIGRRRRDTTGLVLGTNLATEPTATEGAWATEAWLLGAGEGRAMVRGRAGITAPGLRRVKVLQDDKVGSFPQANARAWDGLAATRAQVSVDSLEVFDHPDVPLESIELGDDLPIYAEMAHVTVDGFVRVLAKSESPEMHNRATLTVTRTVTL